MKMERYVPIFGSPDTITIATSHICRQKKTEFVGAVRIHPSLESMESHISLEGILGGGRTPQTKTQLPAPPVVLLFRKYMKISQFGCSSSNLGEMHCWNPSDTVDGQNPTRIEIFKTFKTLLYFIYSYLNWFAGCPSIVLKSKIQKRTWFRCISSQVQNVRFFHEQQKHFTNAICRTIVGWRWFVNQGPTR